jgi:hypothetical protein
MPSMNGLNGHPAIEAIPAPVPAAETPAPEPPTEAKES